MMAANIEPLSISSWRIIPKMLPAYILHYKVPCEQPDGHLTSAISKGLGDHLYCSLIDFSIAEKS